MKRKLLLLILAILPAISLFAQVPEVEFDPNTESIIGGKPFPANTRFLLIGKHRANPKTVTAELFKGGKMNRAKALYYATWSPQNGANNSVFRIPVGYQLADGERYDLRVRYYGEPDFGMKNAMMIGLKRETDGYYQTILVSALGKDPHSAIQKSKQRIRDLNSLVRSNLIGKVPEDGTPFPGFSDKIDTKLWELNELVKIYEEHRKFGDLYKNLRDDVGETIKNHIDDLKQLTNDELKNYLDKDLEVMLAEFELTEYPARASTSFPIAEAPKVEEPKEKPVKEPKEKPVKEPKEKPVKEPKEKPVKEPKEKPVKEPKEKPVKEPKEKPVKEPKEKPVKEPKEKPVKEPKEKPVKEPKEKPVKEPKEKPVKEPKEKPVKEPKEKPVKEPKEKPVKEPKEKPVKEPKEKKPKEPKEKPVKEPKEKKPKEPKDTPEPEKEIITDKKDPGPKDKYWKAISLDIGYGVTYLNDFKADIQDASFGPAPFIGVSIPFGRPKFRRYTFGSAFSFSAGFMLTPIRNEAEDDFTGPGGLPVPAYTALGIHMFEVLRLHLGASYQKPPVPEGETSKTTVRPWIGMGLDLNYRLFEVIAKKKRFK